MQGRRIAIDPWLTDEFSLPPGHWLFGRRRSAPSSGPAALAGVEALVLTAHFSDHLHPPTLEALPRGIPVIATSMGAALGAHGLLQSLALFTRGSIEGFASVLAQRGLPTTFHAMGAGDSLEL